MFIKPINQSTQQPINEEQFTFTNLWGLDIAADGAGGILPLGQAAGVELVYKKTFKKFRQFKKREHTDPATFYKGH